MQKRDEFGFLEPKDNTPYLLIGIVILLLLGLAFL